MAALNKDAVLFDFSPMLIVYTDGRVHRIADFPFVPPSPEDPSAAVSSKDVTISPHISARIYLPKLAAADQKLPILVWFHGGGFCIESAFSSLYHRYLNILASEAQAVAVSVEYRLAPESPLPAAYEDCWEALQWVASHAHPEKIGVKEPWLVNHGNFDKILIGGDSAGGNIVHNTLIRAGKIGEVKITGAILSYPYFWGSFEADTESLAGRLWGFVYPTAPDGIDNPLINPFVENAPKLSGLGCSRMFVCVGEKDVLKGVGIRYVEEVKKSGWEGDIELINVEGEDHVFDIFDPYSEKAKHLISRIASFIQH
ncbi:2-hydroxyisoflavanone dehydratase-like [Ipomoea triloba]|uniref:2-hydroxyisoflavanone dehydratase-like n=1 Tax=Ipomoea triloba TaxID=35885 RepID=UPI00125CF5E7|nr:2-hydroxyisoflavanone dehydratase-like [Ipomoea triloba]